ncbi:hypothetical protein Moror_1218 [Moniliophthora roreri MCA 2997]|uniref:Uncharacterized protein n=1 Tax=Moniliophthora roreri (strain MCA 2997) TaxID=1381753 RepID=V2X9Y8_MONRO|nr:hypothetical protein Moror_1218 [Moniliophthora roreri MCA 2997]
MASNVDKISLADVVVVTLLYGIYFVITVVSLALQLWKPISLSRSTSKSRSAILLKDSPMFLGALVLLATITAHWILMIIRLFEDFQHGAQLINSTLNLPSRAKMAKAALMLVTLVTGELMLIYRLWLVWRRFVAITLPILSLAGLAACGIGLIHSLSRSGSMQTSMPWGIGETVCGLATAVYCSIVFGGILYNTTWKSRLYRSDRKSYLVEVLDIIIQCGALFSLWFLAYTVAYLVRSPIESLLADTLVTITGISFALVKARTYVGRAINVSGSRNSSIFEACRGDQHLEDNPGIPMNHITIRVQQTRDTHSNPDLPWTGEPVIVGKM